MRPRRSEASTIWSTIYANRSNQDGLHLPDQIERCKMGTEHRLLYILVDLFESADAAMLRCAGFNEKRLILSLRRFVRGLNWSHPFALVPER